MVVIVVALHLNLALPKDALCQVGKNVCYVAIIFLEKGSYMSFVKILSPLPKNAFAKFVRNWPGGSEKKIFVKKHRQLSFFMGS